MAYYVSHSPYRACVGDTGSTRVDFGLIGRAALVALGVGAAIVALSGASVEGNAEARTLAKGDRIASSSIVSTAPSIGYVVDSTTMTTTVRKGATAPLSTSSPYLAATK